MIRKFLLPALLLAATLSAPAQADVNIRIGDPGFYGRIDIADFPAPRLIFPQPVLIAQPHIVPAPVYLRVPPGHSRDWGRHCHRYQACGLPVYFVNDGWYRHEYAPRYREHRHHHREWRQERRHDRWEDRHERRHDRREERREDRRDDRSHHGRHG